MSEPVIIALIGAAGLVLVAIISLVARISIKVTRVSKDAAETREQVSNNHIDDDGNPINLREEQDRRHAENKAAIERLDLRLSNGLTAISQTIDREFSLLVKAIDVNTRRIDDIEDTIPPKEIPH